MQTMRVLKRTEQGSPRPGDRRPSVAGADSDRACGRPLALRHRGGQGGDHQPPDRGQRAQCHLRAASVRRRAARISRRAIATATVLLQYAQKLASTPGKHDGLYWPADATKGEEESPFGPLIAAERGLPQGSRRGRPVSRLSLPDPDSPGQERPGRCLQLRDQRQHDRRLRDGRLSRPIRHRAGSCPSS